LCPLSFAKKLGTSDIFGLVMVERFVPAKYYLPLFQFMLKKPDLTLAPVYVSLVLEIIMERDG